MGSKTPYGILIEVLSEVEVSDDVCRALKSRFSSVRPFNTPIRELVSESPYKSLQQVTDLLLTVLMEFLVEGRIGRTRGFKLLLKTLSRLCTACREEGFKRALQPINTVIARHRTRLRLRRRCIDWSKEFLTPLMIELKRRCQRNPYPFAPAADDDDIVAFKPARAGRRAAQ